jgi:hypothetical protein
MTKLIATTVVHGAEPGQVHGGAYLVDLVNRGVFRTIELDSNDIEWFGEEGGRGLRGIAFDGETIYIAAGNALLAYDKRFRLLESWRNPYLLNSRGICIFERKLFLTSSGNDCILAFDLDEKKFHWAMQIKSEQFQFRPVTFDPLEADGPLPINKLHLTNVQCGEEGMYIGGLDTGGVLHFNGTAIQMSVELPRGAQDARFLRKGVVFNDSRNGVIRYSGREDGKEDRAISVPFFTPSDHSRNDPDEARSLKRGYARGLCVLSGASVAGGSTLAGVSVYDLRNNKRLMTVNFTKNVREAINCIEALPW